MHSVILNANLGKSEFCLFFYRQNSIWLQLYNSYFQQNENCLMSLSVMLTVQSEVMRETDEKGEGEEELERGGCCILECLQ